jgi:ATP-dependent DNA helicase 2 subunit 2
MAGKEAHIFIIDQGSSMGEHHQGRTESDLDFAMRYVYDNIAGYMITGRTTLNVGILGFRTAQTKHHLDSEEGYENIMLHKGLGPCKVPDLKEIQRKIKPDKGDAGDALSAIIVAVDMMEAFTKKLKYKRRVVLVTNGTGMMDTSDLEASAERMQELGIELVVLGVDFDDPEFGFKEEDKDLTKRENEATFSKLVDLVGTDGSVFGTAAAAIAELSVPKTKDYRPYATYKGQLCLGDPEKYDSAMSIDVERYFRTKVAKPPSASSYVVATDMSDYTGEIPDDMNVDVDFGDAELKTSTQGDTLTSVKNARTYRVVDESAPGGKRDVDRDDLAHGYEYGRTAVPISESDQNVTKLDTVASFTIIGFIPAEKYERFFTMGESCVTIAARTNDRAKLAISSLVHALAELESYVVARLVLKEGKDPLLVMMAPSIEPDLECLIDVPLPFSEDVRTYRFPPLDRVITISGQTLHKHRFLPDDDLQRAMNAYVDAMDISEYGRDDDGNPCEWAAIDDTYSPVLHRIQQAIRRRAVKPDEPVQPPAEILVKYSHPPEELVKASKRKLDALIDAAEVKKVPPRAKGRRTKEAIKPLSGLDVDALLAGEERGQITTENAIPEYKQKLGTAEDEDSIRDASKQMGQIVRDLVQHSVGGSGYGQAIADLETMREELVGLEMPDVYNSFVKTFKDDVLGGKLGGDRRDFWFEIRKAKIGLIDSKTSDVSAVTEEDAQAFYQVGGANGKDKEIPHRGK